MDKETIKRINYLCDRIAEDIETLSDIVEQEQRTDFDGFIEDALNRLWSGYYAAKDLYITVG